jgi:hypothetical protein
LPADRRLGEGLTERPACDGIDALAHHQPLMGGGPESFHLFFEVVLDFRRTPSTIEQLEPSA